MNILSTKRKDMSYCPGCSHGMVLENLAASVDMMGLENSEVCLVSDIGCVGIADRYFSCHTFHGLHGRSITYAEGIKRQRPELNVIVIIGDGGCGIGTAHLVHAARRNVGITVMVLNNFNFGMTGGQHSSTTPLCGVTTTTPGGVEDHPFDICSTVSANGASYVARCNAFDASCCEYIETALRHPGFSLLDIWELCVPYYVSSNKLTRTGLDEMSEKLGMPFGVICNRKHGNGKASVASSLKENHSSSNGKTTANEQSSPSDKLSWPNRTELSVAGSAGQYIQSAVGVIGTVAVRSGLFAAQQNDFPITVRKGHSVSSLIIADQPIEYAGVDEPGLVVILSDDGMQRLGQLDHLNEQSIVIVADEVEIPEISARVCNVNLRQIEKESGKASTALTLTAAGMVAQGWITADALVEAAENNIDGKYREENVQAIRFGAGLELTITGG